MLSWLPQMPSGADPTVQSLLAFARYKGQAEKALLAAGVPRVYIFRPAYIYPVEPRREPNLSCRLSRGIHPAFRVLFPNQVIRAGDLGRAMVDLAFSETGKSPSVVLGNRDIRAMVESFHRPAARSEVANQSAQYVRSIKVTEDGPPLQKDFPHVYRSS